MIFDSMVSLRGIDTFEIEQLSSVTDKIQKKMLLQQATNLTDLKLDTYIQLFGNLLNQLFIPTAGFERLGLKRKEKKDKKVF